MVTDQAALSMI